MPDRIDSEEQLDDLLAEPTPLSVDAMQKMEGDLMILGVGGKMGPSLARLARRSADAAGKKNLRILGVSRFSQPGLAGQLNAEGIETIACDLLESAGRGQLPLPENVLIMTAFKFGASDRPDLAWATNVYLPGLLAEQFRMSRLVTFSTGNVYPLVPVDSGGASEATPPRPLGEYAITALGRERMMEYVSHEFQTPVCLLRLNYAVELRYGVLVDLGQKILSGEPIDLGMSRVNIVWQGYANAVALQGFQLASSPADALNLTGPETLRIRTLAEQLGQRLGEEPKFSGEEGETALLNDASRCHERFGPPEVNVEKLLDWTAAWLKAGLPTHGKPTKFQVRDGKF